MTGKPEYYKRVLVTYRDANLKKTFTIIGYMRMDGTWCGKGGNPLKSRVMSWRELEE